jgi:hypothetical protein
MLVYFMVIWYNLWPFGIVCGHLLYFFQFGMFGNPGLYIQVKITASEVSKHFIVS